MILFLLHRCVCLCHILESTYTWYHMVFVFLFLIYFTYCENLLLSKCSFDPTHPRSKTVSQQYSVLASRHEQDSEQARHADGQRCPSSTLAFVWSRSLCVVQTQIWILLTHCHLRQIWISLASLCFPGWKEHAPLSCSCHVSAWSFIRAGWESDTGEAVWPQSEVSAASLPYPFQSLLSTGPGQRAEGCRLRAALPPPVLPAVESAASWSPKVFHFPAQVLTSRRFLSVKQGQEGRGKIQYWKWKDVNLVGMELIRMSEGLSQWSND